MPADTSSAARLAFLLALALACGGRDPDRDPRLAPAPTSVVPAEGWATAPTAVVIHGGNFLVRTVQAASGGAPSVDTRHRAWLGGVELQDVVWVDVQTLHATVPAGVPAGPQPLTVENALGGRGELASAFVVRAGPAAALEATLAASAATSSVGQEVTLTLTLTNAGAGAVTNLAPAAPALAATSGLPAVSVVQGPTPATIAALAPGATATFTWAVAGTASGGATLTASASGADALGGEVVAASASVALLVQRPAALALSAFTATSPVKIGDPSALTLTLENAGEAAARLDAIATSLRTAASQSAGSCGPVTPALPVAIPGGAPVTFTWTCTPSAKGNLLADAAVTAIDANSGASASPAVPQVGIAVQ
jgi:hypothetical protein